MSRADQERFASLYAARYRAIYCYVYRRLAPRPDEVRDVVADVFSVAWRRIEDVPAGEQELMWLYGVARRCVLRSQRTHWRRARLLTRLAEEARARRDYEPAPRQDEVRDAIQRLRPKRFVWLCGRALATAMRRKSWDARPMRLLSDCTTPANGYVSN